MPPDVPPPSLPRRSRRWRSRSRSVSTSCSRSSSRSPQRGHTLRIRTPLPLSPRRNSRSHATSIPSPRRPNDNSSRSRNERSRPSDPQSHADRRRSREEVIDRSRGYDRAAPSSQPMHRRGREALSRRERFPSPCPEDALGSNDGDNCGGESVGGIVMDDGKTQEGQGPEQHYVDADEQHCPASSNRSGTLVSPDCNPSPSVLPPPAPGSQSSAVNERHGENARPPDSLVTDQLAGPTRPPASSGDRVRRVASARVKPRTLLESVQAHLSLRPHSEHGLTKSGSSLSPAVPSHEVAGVPRRNASRPSLLERLSDTVLPLPKGGAQEPIDRETSLYGDALRSPPGPSSQCASAGINAEERRSVDDGLTVEMASTRTGE